MEITSRVRHHLSYFNNVESMALAIIYTIYEGIARLEGKSYQIYSLTEEIL